MENENTGYKFSLKSADINYEQPQATISAENGANFSVQNNSIFSNKNLPEGSNFALTPEDDKTKNISALFYSDTPYDSNNKKIPIIVSIDTSNDKVNNAINFLNNMNQETKDIIDRSYKKDKQYGYNLNPLSMKITPESEAMSIATGKKEYTAKSLKEAVTDMNSISNVEKLSLTIAKDISKDLEVYRENKGNQSMQKALLDKVLIYKTLKENGLDVDKGMSQKDMAGFKALVESADRYVERNKPVQNFMTDEMRAANKRSNGYSEARG